MPSKSQLVWCRDPPLAKNARMGHLGGLEKKRRDVACNVLLPDTQRLSVWTEDVAELRHYDSYCTVICMVVLRVAPAVALTVTV